MFKAILTSTVCPIDGVYAVETIHPDTIAQIGVNGVPHYIGHPSTRKIVEELGAVKAPSNLFEGLQPQEKALVVSIAQGKSTRATTGITIDQEVTIDDLVFRVITRKE